MTPGAHLTLSIPPKELNPNSRSHFMAKSRKVKAYRNEAKIEALRWIRSGMGSKPTLWESAVIQALFFVPDARSRDKDNLLASLKSAFDGLADAGLVVNDRCFNHLPLIVQVDRERPRVELLVVPL